MKKLVSLLFLSLSMISFSQVDSLNVDLTQAERIVDKYTGQITDAFEKGLDKVTPVAEQGFDIAVTMQKAYGYGELAKGLTSILVIIFIAYIQSRCYKLVKDHNGDEDMAISSYVAGGLIQVFCIIYSTACIYDGILYLAAPEWFAIKEIISLFN